jgi:ABC-type transport system involved in multi-copper enzyme maturation permease subunit
MRTLAKEFHQQKWMLLGGCLAGLAFPFLAYVTFSVVLFAGAFFGILLAAATTWHDARRGAADFMLSKPFNCRRIFVTKVALAALLLLLAMLIMISIDLALLPNSRGDVDPKDLLFSAYSAIWLTWPIAVMLFALTMFLVVVTKDSAKSVLMAIWAGLLVYFLLLTLVLIPLLISRSGDLVTFYDFWQQMMLPFLPFVGAMAAATVAFTWLAIVAMKKRWHWQPGQKTLVWAMGLASLFIFAQIVFHVGYNLRPATEAGGRKIRNPFSFIVASGPESTLSWPGLAEGRLKPRSDTIPRYGDAVCCKDDLMFIASMANENMMDPNTHEDAYLQHAVLYVYRFPYAGTPDSPVSVLDLSRSPRIVPKGNGWGVVMKSWIKDNWLYVCYCPLEQHPKKKDVAFEGDIHIVAVDIANPAAPVIGGEIVVNCLAGSNAINPVAVKGDYCYVRAGADLAIISLETPGEPHLVKEVPFASLTHGRMINRDLPESVAIYSFTIVDNMLLFRTDIHLGAFDISEPANPRALFFEDVRKLSLPLNSCMLWNGDYCYFSTYDGLYVVKLLKDQGGRYSLKYVGTRKATPLEKLAGREDPRQLLFYNGYLVEAADRFGLLVYDISDPAHPRRLYHADISGSHIEILNGLLYVQSWHNPVSVLFDLPKAP